MNTQAYHELDPGDVLQEGDQFRYCGSSLNPWTTTTSNCFGYKLDLGNFKIFDWRRPYREIKPVEVIEEVTLKRKITL